MGFTPGLPDNKTAFTSPNPITSLLRINKGRKLRDIKHAKPQFAAFCMAVKRRVFESRVTEGNILT
jgi:hypothetical protein